MKDATRSARDRVEVFVDENNGKTPAYEEDDAAHVFRRNRLGNDPVRFRFHERPGGYDLDAAIPIARELALGAEVGFDVRVRDAEAQAVAAWNDFTLSQETDTSKFGTLVLIGPSRRRRSGAARRWWTRSWTPCGRARRRSRPRPGSSAPAERRPA